MGLEFDVATQLFPNPLSILTQLLATFIIFMVAKKYLFKEARKFLQARQDKMQENLQQAEAKHLEANQILAEAKQDLAKIQGDAKHLKQEAKVEALELKEKLIQEAKSEADAIVLKAREKVEREKQAAFKDIEKHIVDVAINASGKLLEKDYSSIDEQAALSIVKELRHE